MSLKIRAGLLLAALALTGCPRPAVPDDVPAYEPARTFDAERVRQRLSAAIARYEAGDFGRAVELFRLFGAEFPGHPDEARAELYLGRALIAASQPVEARQVLEPLAGGAADTGATARFYVAFIDSLEDRLPAALDAIGSWSAERSIDDLLGLVLPGDEPLALSLVAESQFAAGRDASGLEALARLARLDGAGSLAEYARIRSSERMALDVPAERVTEVWSQLGPEARADVLCGAAGARSSLWVRPGSRKWTRSARRRWRFELGTARRLLGLRTRCSATRQALARRGRAGQSLKDGQGDGKAVG
jgi:hypothetical protein